MTIETEIVITEGVITDHFNNITDFPNETFDFIYENLYTFYTKLQTFDEKALIKHFKEIKYSWKYLNYQDVTQEKPESFNVIEEGKPIDMDIIFVGAIQDAILGTIIQNILKVNLEDRKDNNYATKIGNQIAKILKNRTLTYKLSSYVQSAIIVSIVNRTDGGKRRRKTNRKRKSNKRHRRRRSRKMYL